MTAREKLAAAFLLAGLIFCTSAQLVGNIIGVILMGLAALVLNTAHMTRRRRHRTRRTGRRVICDD